MRQEREKKEKEKARQDPGGLLHIRREDHWRWRYKGVALSPAHTHILCLTPGLFLTCSFILTVLQVRSALNDMEFLCAGLCLACVCVCSVTGPSFSFSIIDHIQACTELPSNSSTTQKNPRNSLTLAAFVCSNVKQLKSQV